MGLFKRNKPVVLYGEDRMVLAALRETEAQTNEPSNLHSYLYFPDAKAAEAAAAEVRAEGFSTDVPRQEPKGKWLVIAERDGSAVNERTLPGMVAALQAIEARYRGELDGWGVSV